ncbi:protein NLP6-like isoform X1 [Pistacia vera]|uniref:protein NLP6-like isoform X1 n=2 Tax=Pistacia vera TaxID=55513 RepID=UPI001263465A|nr:protein NLP6-like isoform X1 [Pistacia vera]
MPEPDEDTHLYVPSSRSKDVTVVAAASSIMDLDVDLDLDNPWPLDQSGFVSNPMSPFLISTSEQPCSPLWAFSDADNDDRIAAHANYPLFLKFAGNPSAETENPKDNDENRKLPSLPSPFSGLVPLENSDGYCMIKERMTQALRYFKESTEQHVLAQVWVPVKVGGRYVLTTSGQPFVLDPHSNGLHQYRMVSLMYMFSVDGDNGGELGLPGRVFWKKLPEWTPNVQYYSSTEYSRLDHALNHNVRGTMALPVFEPSGQSCVGVIELVLTSQKINYAPEVDKVCKALQAVNLKSSEILDHTSTQICNEGRQNALAEILEILSVVCETHKLPLAQTWVPCRHRSVLAYGGGLKKSCSSIDGSCIGRVCMSTTDVACYIVDGHMWGFREACVEHHLQKGQGVAGRAFFSLSSCFCNDITRFCKTEYPLVHYARMFGLTSCFAICLRSTYTGDDDYILEFFLPPVIRDSYEQQTLLGSILSTMKQRFHSLKVASGVEFEGEGSIEIIEASVDEKLISRFESVRLQSVRSPPGLNALPKGGELPQPDLSEQQLLVSFDTINDGGNVVSVGGGHNPVCFQENKNTKKPSERKRGKTEKSISLEVLQQYFAGSLKDAAKSLGVCPTTMKRICRQHGISRWPSRKINKVNRSLSKLKRVIESVHVADGTFGLTSLTTSPLPVAVGSISWPSGVNGSNQQHSPNSKPSEPLGEKSESPNCRTPGNDAQAGVDDQLLGEKILNHKELSLEQNALSPEIDKGSKSSGTGSGSREGSAGTPTSHGSCQGSPANASAPSKDPHVSVIHEPCFKVGGSPELALQTTGEMSLTAAFSIPDALVTTELQEPFGGMLVEDAGSSKDLRNLCPAAVDAIVEEQFLESSWPNLTRATLLSQHPLATSTQTIPRVPARQEMKSMTIKATYREDIIRFRISLSSGIVELKEEVGKRLKLEVGTFDIKYLDDDQEWVLIACDADLHECLDISRSSGSNIIRLSIHDLTTNLGSSCESTGEL